MRNPFRYRWVVVGENHSTGERKVIRRYWDRVAAEQRAELLNAFGSALGLRKTKAHIERLP